MLLHMQQLLQLYALLNYLPPSVQVLDNRANIKKSSIDNMDQTGDVIKLKQIIQQLKETLTLVDPLSVWLNKDSYPTLETVQIDVTKIPSCIQNQKNLRLELVLLKVLKREAINVVIYGGSNCAQGMFPVLLHDWWNEVIMPVSGSSLNVKVIGIGGTGSSYYQFCHEIYLDDNETIDLVIIETAVNDIMFDIAAGEPNVSRSLPLEQFTRQLLKRANNPAVFYVNMFMVTENSQCLNLVDYGQGFISELYGITTINLRCLSCRFFEGKFYSNSWTEKVQDGLHSKLLGHAQAAFMIIHVISKTFGKIAQDINRLTVHDLPLFWFYASTSIIPALPLPVYIKGESSTIRSPKCWANLTPNYKKSLIRDTLSLAIVENAGFNYLDEVTIGKGSYSAENVARTDAFGGLFANTIGSQVTVSFTLPPQRCQSVVHTDSVSSITTQTLSSSVLTGSVGILSRYGSHGGTVDAWLDDCYDKRVRIRLQSEKSQTAVIVLATRVEPGIHTLTVQIVEEGNSVLVGVFVGPCDWP